MKLKKLVVQGFKSFKDRTTITFDNGITGIVGPNGCGKSNIVDALFWVMGEQSAKHLRGNTMKDVIFAGSSKYNPSSFAEATLVLENTEGKHIHIGNKVSSPSEIQLTRKLYRNGESEYRINGNPARLRDIQEVFMDTGAGAKSYSIIAQGEINKLVQAKPEERRVMIEEVAGITKFKARKRESMRKIEQTQANLSRLQDLQSEIEKNLKALQKQAEKAERARSLRDKIKRNDVIVNAHRVFDHLKYIRDGKIALNEKSIEVETWQARKNTLEVDLQEERIQRDEKTSKIDEFQKEYNEISKRLAASEERLNYLCQNLTEKEGLIDTRKSEQKELEEEKSHRQERLMQLQKQREEFEQKRNEQFDFSELEAFVEELRERLDSEESQLQELEATLATTKEELFEVEQVIFRNASKLEEYAAALQDTTEEIEVLEKQYSGVSKQITNERDEVHQAESQVSELSQEEVKLKEQINTKHQTLNELELQLREKMKESIQTESRLSSLKEINASLEGLKEGSTEFLSSHKDDGFELLGNIIKCDEKYTKAVQNLLGDYLETLISTKDDLQLFYSWCENNPEKALDFLYSRQSGDEVNIEILERLKLFVGETIIPLSDIVQIPAGYSEKLNSFFAGFFIAPELKSESFEELPLDIKFKGISNAEGSIVVRSVGGAKILSIPGQRDHSQGVVERNNKIVELEGLLDQIAKGLEELETNTNTQRDELEGLEAEYESLRDRLADSKADYAAKKSALESKLKAYETSNTRLDILKKRKSEISKSRLELLESEEGLNSKQKDLSSQAESLDIQQKEKKDLLADIRQNYSLKKEELVSKQVEANSFEERFSSVASQIEDINQQIERQETRLKSNYELIQKYEEEILSVQKELEDLEKNNILTVETLKEKDSVLKLMKDDLAALLQGMQEREDEVKDLSQRINKNDKDIAEYEIKLEKAVEEESEVVRNTFEKYQVDLRKSVGRFLDFTDQDYELLHDVSGMFFIETEEGTKEIYPETYEFHRRYGQDLKDCSHKLRNYKAEFGRLGEINWQAIEDYDRQKLRFDFLKIQETELKESLEDLERAIAHIDEKSKQRFKIAFDEVNGRFEKVFPIIFGGGNAHLKLIGDINDPECGVDIVAQPPGKKMQNINLMSGGEKALTAVSLIFSIFLVKPSPFCLLDEVDAPLDDANVGRFNELLREMSEESQFILITHNKKTMELNDTLYGVTMQEPGISSAVSVQLH